MNVLIYVWTNIKIGKIGKFEDERKSHDLCKNKFKDQTGEMGHSSGEAELLLLAFFSRKKSKSFRYDKP